MLTAPVTVSGVCKIFDGRVEQNAPIQSRRGYWLNFIHYLVLTVNCAMFRAKMLKLKSRK